MNKLLGVIRRFWRLLQIMRAVRRIRRSHGEQERLLARQALADHFELARGVTMKVGQLFAGGEDEAFTRLVKGIEPLPLKQLLPIMEQALGVSPDQVFSDLEPYGKAASLGQVHRATLKDGTSVAVKVRYPFIADAVEAEMKLAGLIPGMGPVKRWGINLDAYRDTLRNNMELELDYRSEAERQAAYADAVRVPGLVVPKVYSELSSEQLLVTGWQEGAYLDEISDWPLKARLLVGRTLLQNLFVSMFVHGQVHGDPHLGNTLYRLNSEGEPEVALLDFGCTIPVVEQRRLALLRIILALREGEEISLLRALMAAGFDASKLIYIREHLPAICQALFHPFLVEGSFHPEQWQLSRTMLALLGEQRWWFRAAGPSDSMLLVRAFDGLIDQLETLDVRLPWWPVLKQAVGDEVIDRAKALELPELPPEVAELGDTKLHPARQLRVQIIHNGNMEVDVTMPAVAALDLPTLMPEAAIKAVSRLPGADLDALPDRLRSEGIKPQTLFEFEMDGRDHKIWLQ